MATHDYIIANADGATVRADINDALEAIVSNNSSTSEPATTYAYMWWADTTNGLLKQRNAADSDWVIVATLAGGAVPKTSETGSAILPSGDDSERDGSPVAGYLRWNTDQGSAEIYDGSNWGSVGGGAAYGLFRKADPSVVLFTKTGAGTAETQTALYAEVNGSILTVASGTSVTMPALTAGTDYAIWLETDGDVVATSNHASPPTANARKIGGFHYAPGGNAAAQAGGDTTDQINEYSFWDLKFRPACSDPRGMTLVAGHFWADIYLLNTDPDVNGTSANDTTIANGNADYPKIPAAFNGNGSTTYGSFTWFEAQEILGAYGKRCPTYSEFMQLAFGTTEEQSRGSDPVTTGLATTNTGSSNDDEEFTSKWGVIQASGVYWIWSRDFIANGTGSGGWQDITEGRGEVYTYGASARAGFLGGVWFDTSDAGSRCSDWTGAPSFSGGSIGARGVADHLQID